MEGEDQANKLSFEPAVLARANVQHTVEGKGGGEGWGGELLPPVRPSEQLPPSFSL